MIPTTQTDEIPTTQTDEILDFIADVFDALDGAREDDNKVSTMEAVAMVRLAPALMKAVGGVSELKAEWTAMSREKLSAMRDEFLTRRNWQPTDDARDRADVIFQVASSIIMGLIQWRNTTNPPKAKIA